jgi:integrase
VAKAVFKEISLPRPRHQSGHVTLRGTKRKYYYGEFNIYMKDSTGKSVRKHRGEFLGYKSETTKSEAEDKLQKLIFAETGQGISPTDKVTLDWFWENRFRPMRQSRWEASSQDSFLCDWSNYIKPKLGDVTLAKFDKFMLQTHFNQLAAADYSEWVVKRAKTLLSSVFMEAVDLSFLTTNPMAKVKLPKCKPTPKPVISIDDVRRLYQAIPSLRDRLIFRIGISLGPRASEVFGLTVDSWKGDVLEIRHTAYKGTLRKAKVKTDGSRRTIPVPPDMRVMLQRWIEWCGASGDQLLFPGKGGNSPMWPGVWMQKHLQKLAREIGLDSTVTFQVLRRSFATRHRNELKDAGAVLGHANYATTTANVYAQSVADEVKAMVEEDERQLGLVEPVIDADLSLGKVQ